MHPSLQTLLTTLIIACSPSHSTTLHTPQPLPKSQTIPPTNFSPTDCWQSFELYLLQDNLTSAAARFQPHTTSACYQYATQKAAIEKLRAVKEKTIEKYLTLILQYENNPTLSYIDERCKIEKEKMQQQYNFPTLLNQIYTDAATALEQQFPWIIESKEYQTEKKNLSTLLNALTHSLNRPYCDSNQFEQEIESIRTLP